jgi:tRNA U34 5-methylaminomethyl-2-thiouridine-forming methyltransferase MnmC
LSNQEIFITGDGSHSLLNKDLNETYHSIHGAVQESKYIFIDKGLEFYTQQHNKNKVHILEIGFGTGLNAFLTLLYNTAASIDYATLEAYPLEEALWSELNYADVGNRNFFEQLHTTQWDVWIELNSKFSLLKIKNTLQSIDLAANQYDIIYFDAFAPNKQPEMWEVPMLQKIVDCMAAGGVFVTYCAKGQLKRDLKNLGLQVETLTGPPGKKEMVRAIKI